MANSYTDVPEIKFHMEHPLMKRIVELKERNYADYGQYDYAPKDYEDAQENYDSLLEITGDINANIIGPNSEDVDAEGPHCENGRVRYASKTYENLDATIKAGLCGMTMPRRYGGLNLPNVVYTAANEIIAEGDAGFENIWSLQDCIETLYEFGDEDQRKRYIPRVCAGETMSMDLTEPDAGSDLQSVMLKATFDEKENCWRLNGVKRFITNGDADIHLVLARSVEGTRDGRGLSMFIYDKRNGGVNVRRIENKLGIHGSPTCELVYKNAKAELCGSEKLGLIKYVMGLMNGARLGIASQSVGAEQAAYEEAINYARDRKQFGKEIIHFPAVYDMIARIKAKLDAGRSLLYMTARYVDIYKCLDDISKERKLTPEERDEFKKYSKLADAFTPLAKGMNSEFANESAYDRYPLHHFRLLRRSHQRLRGRTRNSRICSLCRAHQSHERETRCLHREGKGTWQSGLPRPLCPQTLRDDRLRHHVAPAPARHPARPRTLQQVSRGLHELRRERSDKAQQLHQRTRCRAVGKLRAGIRYTHIIIKGLAPTRKSALLFAPLRILSNKDNPFRIIIWLGQKTHFFTNL